MDNCFVCKVGIIIGRWGLVRIGCWLAILGRLAAVVRTVLVQRTHKMAVAQVVEHKVAHMIAHRVDHRSAHRVADFAAQYDWDQYTK